MRVHALWLAAAVWPTLDVTAQVVNPGAFVSPQSAASTAGINVLFFGNSYTISSSNPAVHSPAWGGARGVPELVRQIAIAAGHPAPFVKNVYHLNRGLDHHLSANAASLGHIDEPALEGESWDYVVLQGFSTRSTQHPYTGNPRLHQENSWRLFDEVRDGATNHTSKHPGVVPVLYQAWARQPDHWFYDVSSPHTAGHNIAIGVANWTLGPLFAGPAAMAEEVRSSYDEAQRLIERRAPSAGALIAPVGDAWQAADWGRGFGNLYAADHYHASSRGDLLTALTIYGTLYGDADTQRLAASGVLQPVAAAIGVTGAESTQLTAWADQVLAAPPVAQPPQLPPSAVLVDFSDLAGPLVGPEQRPVAGRHYNTIADPAAGRVRDARDTENRPTGIEVAVVDAFAGATGGGANGGFIGAVNISGSLYDVRAQRDGFLVGRGAGYDDPRGTLELRGLDPSARYDLIVHGTRESTTYPRVGTYGVRGVRTLAAQTLDAAHNLNLVLTFTDVQPDARGVLALEVSSGTSNPGFGYLSVLELRRAVRLEGGDAPAPGAPVGFALHARAYAGKLAITGTSLGLGPLLWGPHLLRLDADALLAATLGATSPILSGYVAVLDGGGNASPALTVPPLAALRGIALHTASVVLDTRAPGGVAGTSNTWSLRVR